MSSSSSSKAKSVKDLSSKIWEDIGSVEVTSASDLRTGKPMLPIIGSTLRAIILDVIRSCADEVEANPLGGAANLRDIADRLSSKRLHHLYVDLKDHTDGEDRNA